MADDATIRDFGCERCWPPAAAAAWEGCRSLTCTQALIDESHFSVAMLACPRCAQRFVRVFTETIDWQGGEDPQYWTVLPITEAEALDLSRQPESLVATRLGGVGQGRRSLQRDHPRAAAPQVFWGTGITVGPHD